MILLIVIQLSFLLDMKLLVDIVLVPVPNDVTHGQASDLVLIVQYPPDHHQCQHQGTNTAAENDGTEGHASDFVLIVQAYAQAHPHQQYQHQGTNTAADSSGNVDRAGHIRIQLKHV